MLSLEQILPLYPHNLQPFKRNILREYFQYKILELIFASIYASKLSFLGGTALRIVYENTRFSEDLDFDNFGLSESEFTALAKHVQRGLEAQGLTVEMNIAGKGVYRCNIRLPDILFSNNLSTHWDEKILIQIDSAAHHFDYRPDNRMLNKFDVFTEIFVTPIDILLSQKIRAALERKRAKGRDYFDIVFLLARTVPNYDYLAVQLNIPDVKTLRERILKTIDQLDMKELGRDVEPFLFNPGDAKKIDLFREFWLQAKLN